MDTIWIGNDHGGYDMKCQILTCLTQNNIPFNDVGCHSAQIVRYPYYAAQVARAVSTGAAQRGILICSTGIGMSIIANKFPHVRAALCATTYTAKMTRAHNDSNILCLGGKTTGIDEALSILHEWLSTPYMGGRHDISLSLIDECEKVQFSQSLWLPDFEHMR